MQLKASLALLAATAQLSIAAPTVEDPKVLPKLRLVKTSPEEDAKWVTEEEKAKLIKAGDRSHFIDVTESQEDTAYLSAISGKRSAIKARQASYPDSLSHADEAKELIENVSNSGPQEWLEALTEFHNRHYQSSYGTEAGEWLLEKVRDVASANSAIEVETFEHRFDQPSIIARIPGSSSTDKVIVGAHYDSTTGSASGAAPGADDNGTGSVNVLEALRVLADAGFAPENTLEFHWYGGEEGGLLGSQDLFRSYASDGASVLAFVNQDMTGYSPGGQPTVFTDYTDDGLTAFVTLALEEFTGLDVSTSSCGYGCSDHASADAAGFPAAFVASEPIESSNPNIHTTRDTYDSIDWEPVQRHSEFTVGFLVEASYL